MTAANPLHPWLAAILRAHIARIKARDKRRGNGGDRSAAGRAGKRRLRALGLVFNGSAQAGARRRSLNLTSIPRADRPAVMRAHYARRCEACCATLPLATNKQRQFCADCSRQRHRDRARRRYWILKSRKEQQINATFLRPASLFAAGLCRGDVA